MDIHDLEYEEIEPIEGLGQQKVVELLSKLSRFSGAAKFIFLAFVKCTQLRRSFRRVDGASLSRAKSLSDSSDSLRIK